MNHILINNLAKDFAKQLALLITETSLYPPQHPSVVAQGKHTFDALISAQKEIKDFTIDIAEGQFVFDGIPLYEIKHAVEKPVQIIAAKEIKSITFSPEVSIHDLSRFIRLLVDKTSGRNADNLRAEMAEAGISAISVEKKAQSIRDEETELLPPEKVYGSSIEANKLIFNALQTSNALPMDVIDKIAKEITNLITRDTSSSLALASLRSYDEYTFTHSANVAILSVAMASSFISDKPSLNQLAKAALLHDIGKTKIPLTLLNKPDALSEEEWKIMRRHPILGAAILEQQNFEDQLSVVICTQHHMKYDMSGYPQITGITAIHPLAMVVNICDIYDAITSRRVYRKPLPPDKALAIMMRLIGCDIDPHFFKIFIQMMGVYPPGSFVRLNTNELAMIKHVYPHALLLPEIKIVIDALGNRLEEPLLLNLADHQQGSTPRDIKEIVDPQEIGIDPLSFF